MSQLSADAICRALKKRYKHVEITTINSLSDLRQLIARQPDLVFLGMKYLPPGSDENQLTTIWLSDYLESAQIAHTGSGSAAHELELNKHLAKRRMLESGLKTSPFYVSQYDQAVAVDISGLRYPLFVKPTNRGGGQGIASDSLIHNEQELKNKLTSIAATLQADSLIEEYLPGREFSVALLEDLSTGALMAMPIELVAPIDYRGSRLLSQSVKKSDAEQVLLVASGELRTNVTTLAKNAFHCLGGRDYGRIDIRLDQYGEPHFLEANLLPSLIGGYGSFPKSSLLNIGLDYEPMIYHIALLGLRRQKVFDDPIEIAEDSGSDSLVSLLEPAVS